MTLPYLLRLLCLCFASFFVLNAAAGLLVRAASKSAVRFAGSKAPASAARFLLAVRLFPFALAALFVLCFCIPSYFWLEPFAAFERVSVFCVVLGFLGAAAWALSMLRTADSLLVSRRHNRLCRQAGREVCVSGNSSTLIVVEREAPLLAMSGVFRPRLLISRSVLSSLSPQELDAALRHEHAHRTSLDNVKRLLLLLAPDFFPFIGPFRLLERQWSKFTEWAADDEAAAGNSSRALSLAAALVRVARMGSSPRLPFLSTSLLACDRDLSARVDRLLHAVPPSPAIDAQSGRLLRAACLFLVGCVAVLLLALPTLSFVHELLELLLH
ncbi:MAG TPA: hypothetical protein VNH65_13910 [Candidatus Acidoferrum sp.]|nr:hypothetical protein [Candidatus Acidoferrum sp.]